MHSEPDFELLAPPPPAAIWRWMIPAAAILALSTSTWAAYEWLHYRRAAAELAVALAAEAKTPMPASAPEPAYAKEALQIAELLQTPVDAWLRELEHCQPDNARTRELRVDAAARRVTTLVEVHGQPEPVAWMQCLNAGLPTPAWHLVRMAAVDGGGVGGKEAQAVWTVELNRSGR